MRIERVRIHNFRRFRDVDLELPDGVTGLVGRNGAGKSTFLEAIGWCLYGHDAARTGKELIKRRGAAPGDDVHVHVAFRFGGHAYEVTRELLGKGGSHLATIKAGGGVVVPAGAQSGKEATAYVSRLFHMDRDAFFTSLVARQRELAALSDAKPAERRRILLSLLRIDAVDVAITEARAQKRDARKTLEGMRAVLRESGPLQTALAETKSMRAKQEDELSALALRIAGLTEDVEEKRRVRDDGRAKLEQHRLLQGESGAVQARLAELSADLARREAELARCQEAATQALALQPDVDEIPAARERLEAFAALRIRAEELARVRTQVRQAEAETAAAQREAEAARVGLAGHAEARVHAGALPAERAAAEAKLQATQRRREALTALAARHAEVARLRALVDAATRDRDAALGEARDATEATTGAGVVRRLAERLPGERAKVEAGVAEANRRLADADAAVRAARAALSDLEAKRGRIVELGPESPCPTCTRPLREHHDGLLHDLGAQLDAQREALAAARAAVAAAREAEAEARQRLADLAAREAELRAKQDQLARDETRLEAANVRVAEAESRLARLTGQVGSLDVEPFEEAQLQEAQRDEEVATRALRALAAREAELSARLQAAARDEARLEAALARGREAAARAQQLRDQTAALAAEGYDANAHEAAAQRVRALEGVRDRQARLLAEADRASALRIVIEGARERADEAAALLEASRARLAALAFDPALHAANEAAADAADAKLSEARLVRERLRGDAQRAADEETRLADEIARQAELAARAVDLEKRVRLLEHLAGDRDAGLLPEFKDHLIARIRPLVSTHAGRLFRELTDGRYADLELGEDYDLRVHEDGEAFALSRFSGGESDLANLCLRLAVGQVVAERAGTEGFGFLALDEIFGSQDDVRKGNILRQLQGLTGRFRQILLVTHIEDVKEAADHVLRVEALDDGTSRVVLES